MDQWVIAGRRKAFAIGKVTSSYLLSTAENCCCGLPRAEVYRQRAPLLR
jgi:hypothetical protein